MTQTAQSRPHSSGGPEIRIGAIIALLAVIGIVVWLLVRSSSSSPTSTSTQATQSGIPATAVSVAGLRGVAIALQQPIFWIGARAKTTYELTETNSGARVYVRYLPRGVKVGSPRQFLTVGTYAIPNAYAATLGVARRSASVRIPVGKNAIAFYTRSTPDNVYEAFSASPYQLEIYSPVAAQARDLVAAKQVTAVNGVTDMGAVAASETEIESVGRDLGHRLYWLGDQPRDTYEVTELADGEVFIRYLPHGVAVGSSKPYPTVGTYPMANAYKVTEGVAAGAGMVKVDVPGAIAFYKAARPTSVFIAYKGSDTQIEVYDPVSGTSRALVAGGKLQPVG